MKHVPGPIGCVDTSNHAHDYRLTKPDGSLLPVDAPANDHSQQRATAARLAACYNALERMDPNDVPELVALVKEGLAPTASVGEWNVRARAVLARIRKP